MTAAGDADPGHHTHGNLIHLSVESKLGDTIRGVHVVGQTVGALPVMRRSDERRHAWFQAMTRPPASGTVRRTFLQA